MVMLESLLLMSVLLTASSTTPREQLNGDEWISAAPAESMMMLLFVFVHEDAKTTVFFSRRFAASSDYKAVADRCCAIRFCCWVWIDSDHYFNRAPPAS